MGKMSLWIIDLILLFGSGRTRSQCFGILWRRLSTGHGNIHGASEDRLWPDNLPPLPALALCLSTSHGLQSQSSPEEVETQAIQEPTDLRQVPPPRRASHANSAVP